MNGENPASKPSALILYTIEEAAAQLLVSRRWLQDFIRVNPHYRMAGRRKVFTAADIKRLYEALPVPWTTRPLVRTCPKGHLTAEVLRELDARKEARKAQRGEGIGRKPALRARHSRNLPKPSIGHANHQPPSLAHVDVVGAWRRAERAQGAALLVSV